VKIHPNDETLEEVLLAMEEDHRRVVFHMAHCSLCRSKLHYLPRPQTMQGEAGLIDYEAILVRALGVVADCGNALFQERDDAPGLLVELLPLPFEEQQRRVREDARFQTWGLFELLVERSGELGIPDPAAAEEVARLAIGLSDRLDSSRYLAGLIADLRARAWACLANSLRIRSNLRGAESAFETAFSHLDSGSGDSLELGILLDLRASLLRDQRDLSGAVGLLRQAIEIFDQGGDPHRAGRSMVNLATVYAHSMRFEEAIPVLLQSIEKIDGERDPRLLLCARHNLISYLTDLNRSREAQRLYRSTRPLYRSFAEPWVQNRRKWVRAKIARGFGQTAHAETLYLRARDGFVAEGIPYDTALVSLELASLYAEQGRTAELKRLSEEMLPIFTSQRIHREALAALGFFRAAVDAEQANATLIAAVAGFLKRAEHDPGLRFEGVG
jgi:tetratricopeptide (TPR) repeat protein